VADPKVVGEIRMALRYFKNDPTLKDRALQIYLILIGVAQRRETITYGTLAAMLGYGTEEHPGGGVMAQRLGPIMEWCQRNRLPALTAVVVNKDSGIPGDGLITVSGDAFTAAQQKVYKFDWYSIYPPTPKELEG
jgi:hypothetical protein